MSELPDGPWEKLSTDFHGPLPSGHYLLVIIDQYSRYPVVEIVKSTSAKATIPIYDKIFGLFGMPLHIKSDNGSPFNSKEFENFAKYSGFKHDPITPEYPQANGLVEKFNQMLEKVLATAKVEEKNWRQELFRFLRNYRATPHLTTKKSPAELIFQERPFRTRLPEFMTFRKEDADVRDADFQNKAKKKYYADAKPYVKRCLIKEGDWVIVKKRRRTKSSPHYDPVPYKVCARKGNMITAERPNHTITRNSSFFKKVHHNDHSRHSSNIDDLDMDAFQNVDENRDTQNVDNEVDDTDNVVDDAVEPNIVNENAMENVAPREQEVRRSNRDRTVPIRFSDYVMK